ncbi:MAG: hypothetical protein OEZ02_03315 [Anaerolineae bacterium]|nr:hypothetical protein [Anaerolineae bacterium]
MVKSEGQVTQEHMTKVRLVVNTLLPMMITPSLTPTMTSTPEPTIVFTPVVSEIANHLVATPGVLTGRQFETSQLGLARYSYYWPPLGGANCRGECIYMASGLPWKDYVGYAVACPAEFPFGTLIRHNGKVYECLDRGGAIKMLDDGTFWIDFLEKTQRYPFWTILPIEIDFP